MTRETGEKISAEMRRRGTGPEHWANQHGYHRRTVNDLLYHGLGSVRGGKRTNAIFADLIDQGYIDENHEFIEPKLKAS